MEQWHDFFVLAGTAAATLLGLLFVALSVNKESIAGRPLLRSLARQTFVALAIVLLISLLCVAPERAVPVRTTGFWIWLGALICLGVSGAANWRTVHENRRGNADVGPKRVLKEREYVARATCYSISLLLVLCAGAYLWRGNPDGAKWLVPSFMLMGVLALSNSWGLVLRVDESISGTLLWPDFWVLRLALSQRLLLSLPLGARPDDFNESEHNEFDCCCPSGSAVACNCPLNSIHEFIRCPPRLLAWRRSGRCAGTSVRGIVAAQTRAHLGQLPKRAGHVFVARTRHGV
jgi:hypothetical protein